MFSLRPMAVAVSSAPTCGAKIVRADGTPRTCSFDDEFTGSAVDSAKWAPVTTKVSRYSRFSQTYGRFAVRDKFPASTIAGRQSSLCLYTGKDAVTSATRVPATTSIAWVRVSK